MDTGFLSLPMTAGRRDIAVAEDDAGNPVYMTPFGQRYTIRRQNPAQGSRVKAGLEVLKEASKAPLESLTAAAQAMAQGAWQGISAPGRAAAGEPMTYGDVAGTAMDWGLMNAPGLAFGKYDPATVNMGIRAYHGSPHDFDRFDMSKIGTGEGAQAYGHGLYFAEAEDVARQYRDKLSPGMGDDALRAMGVSDGDLRAMRQFTQSAVDPDIAFRDWLGWTGKKETPELRAAFMQEWGAKDPGHLYEVSINADPADFLDWDAPLSEQGQKVRDALASERFAEPLAKKERWRREMLEGRAQGKYYMGPDPASDDFGKLAEPRGEDVLSTSLARNFQEDFEKNLAENALRDAGIPGIKYYDQGSRAGGEGTRNFVVFDDSLIEILRKYGVAGLAPLGATLAGSDQAQY